LDLEGEKSYEKLIMKRNEEPTDFINKVEKKIIYNKIKFLKFRFKKNFKIMKKHKINIEHVSKLS